MKEFDLDKAMKNTNAITKKGQPVQALAFMHELNDEFKLIGVVDGNLERWTVDGVHWGEDSDMDLVLPMERCEGWVNVYRDTKNGKLEFGNKIYKNVTDAENSGKCNVNTYVCTTYISWEE